MRRDGPRKAVRQFRAMALGFRPSPASAGVFCLALAAAVTPPAGADLALGPDAALSLSADFRLRLEQDWDSRRADGSEREDRLRVRARARLGLRWQATEHLSFSARLRSGSDDSHQSPHITIVDFDGGDTGAADFNFDRWYLEARRGELWGWAGRNSFPFWRPAEFLWDDDVTPAGLAGGWSRTLGAGGDEGDELEVRFAYLTPPVGMRAFSGNLGGAQVLYRGSRGGSGRPLGFTLAAALLDFDAASADSDAATLRNSNGLRDYRIWSLAAQASFPAGGRPLTLGADLLHNSEGYRESDPLGFGNRDQTDGWVVLATWGRSQAKGDWLAGLYFAHIETLAVNASFAADDWIRWGSAAETDASDLEGWELRYVRVLGEGQNLMARLYLVEAITSAQDGKRFRLDYNIAF